MCALALGGLEVPPLTFYQVVEAVARLDGSTGWCTFIGGSDGLVGAYLAPQTAEDLFGRDPRVVLAGSVAPAGSATVVTGGYRVSGHWPYASGSQHCTWLFGCCHVLEGDQPRLTATGAPKSGGPHPAAQATILEDTWEVSGLVGTGSHDFTVEQVLVPDAYTWRFGPGMPRGPHYQGPLYRFPLVGLFRLPVSAVALGIAQGAIEACLALAPAKRALVGTGCSATSRSSRPGSRKRWPWCARPGPGCIRRCSRRGPQRSPVGRRPSRNGPISCWPPSMRHAAPPKRCSWCIRLLEGRRTIAAVRSNVRCAMSTR